MAELSPPRWLAISLLVASYLLLIAIVTTGAYWANQEFEDAHEERCSMLGITLELTRLHVQYSRADGVPEPQPAANQELNQLESMIEEVCG